MASIMVLPEERDSVFAALYNGAVHTCLEKRCRCSKMTRDEAREILKKTTYVGVLKGRTLNLDFATIQVRTDNYNRFNGTSRAQNIVKKMKVLSLAV